jgi:hypothetical protein
MISIPIGGIRLLERIFLGKDVFARFIHRYQTMNGSYFAKKRTQCYHIE